MAKIPPQAVIIEELGSDGRPRAVLRCSPETGRLQTSLPPSYSSPRTGTSILNKCMSPFLPAGYPSTVTPDYTPYQIYDSLQAFASTIAGLLASRAVFVGMGVGSEEASVLTTMLLYIAQETVGRVATILFAHQFSQRIEAEVKFYRFFADIVNDVAFVLDCMSPAMPILGRVVTLCLSNACRAVCGVAGGSSKAILSSHFAKAGNIGELNAKDGSQETVISLLGMWVGGVVVSKVHGTLATWSWLVPLLALHLWANWKAVRSVRLNSFNTNRALVFFRAALEGRTLDMEQVAQEETVLGWPAASRGIYGLEPCYFQVGSSVQDLVHRVYAGADQPSQPASTVGHLVQLFCDEDYLLWFDIETGEALVLLKDTATGITQAKGLCHMLRCYVKARTLTQATGRDVSERVDECQGTDNAPETASAYLTTRHRRCFRLLADALHENREQWSVIREQAERAGWDLGLTNLTKTRDRRVRATGFVEDKKVR
ncbi:RUS family member 1 [Exophiala dermatitidis]|uniref:Protein root UVB sensitive/RUS domain-containing protein n=2 Tax=Exophiala dermatitidis TaxID=5970 RepID=H6BVS0_EXODN|nr:uncharacterized protein HMPREF1120_04055 [Exophiala dermatitidis NIH/UT8656]EHY55946.1 hypothetical protein HMPREF1120_04055 [Exophiala dermatitidis NIH/UT8656]